MTPQEAVDQGLPTNDTRMIREYGADLGGPIVRDKLWLWFAGSYQTISTNRTAFASKFGSFAAPETINLEPWSAKLNWQISNANSAQLYFQRSDRTQSNRDAAPSGHPRRRRRCSIPTNFYKVEDSNVFSSDLFGSIFATYQNPDYTQIANGSKDCPPVSFSVVCNGNPNKDIQDYANADASNLSYYNNYQYYFAKDPQKQANLQVSKFFNTGKLNHELKFSFNYRQQIADSATGLAGGSEMAAVLFERELFSTALLSRGVRPVYRNQSLERHARRHDYDRQPDGAARRPLRRQQAENLPGTRSEPLFSQPCTGCGYEIWDSRYRVQYHGAPDWQFDFTNWQPRVSATYALGEKRRRRFARLVRSVRRPARIHRLLRERRADLERLLLLLDRLEPRPPGPAERNRLELRVLRVLQRHRSRGSAERPEHDPVGTEGSAGPTNSPSGSISNSPIRSRCRRPSTTARATT